MADSMTSTLAKILAVLFSIYFFMSYALAAEVCDPSLSRDEIKAHGERIKKLLIDKLYPALEEELGSKVKNIEAGKYNDELLLIDMRAAFKSDPAIEPLLTDWISAYPHSYAARMSRAIYYVSTGYSKRGTMFADKTSAEQFKSMSEDFDKASIDLQAALHYSARPTLTCAEYIRMSRTGSAKNVTGEICHKFPDSLAINAAVATSLNPKWGGSFEQLDALVKSAEKTKMEKAQLQFLRYEVEMEKANYFDVAAKQKRQAIEHYIKAGNICAIVSPWENALRAAKEIDDWKIYMEVINGELGLFPPTGLLIQSRGYAFEKIGKMPEAIQDYEVAAALGTPWAQSKLGWLLWQGKFIPKDLARAKTLLEKSAAQGDQSARTTLQLVLKDIEEKKEPQ